MNSCASCECFLLNGDAKDGKGLCRKSPPVIFDTIVIDGQKFPISGFSPCRANWWCREYSPASPPFGGGDAGN